jgi:hypothetical protein
LGNDPTGVPGEVARLPLLPPLDDGEAILMDTDDSLPSSICVGERTFIHSFMHHQACRYTRSKYLCDKAFQHSNGQ